MILLVIGMSYEEYYEYEHGEPGYIRALGLLITILTIAFAIFMFIVVVSGLMVARASVDATQQALESASYQVTEQGVSIPIVVVNPGLIQIDMVRISISVETLDGTVLAYGEDAATGVKPGERVTLTPTLAIVHYTTTIPQQLITKVTLDVGYAFNTIKASFCVEYVQEVV